MHSAARSIEIRPDDPQYIADEIPIENQRHLRSQREDAPNRQYPHHEDSGELHRKHRGPQRVHRQAATHLLFRRNHVAIYPVHLRSVHFLLKSRIVHRIDQLHTHQFNQHRVVQTKLSDILQIAVHRDLVAVLWFAAIARSPQFLHDAVSIKVSVRQNTLFPAKHRVDYTRHLLRYQRRAAQAGAGVLGQIPQTTHSEIERSAGV
mmetsp:Transcript_19264/g.30550  ORF Transcript_19264/g.30550 Transcript_19264/m.30550 type:complete len:205 (-) Transcript_19264:294-908(-)